MTSVTIGNSVTSIGDRAFSYCSSLTSVTIPNSVTRIGSYAFNGCYFTKESFVNNSSCTSSDNWGATICDVRQSDGLYIKDNVAVKCSPNATSVTIPNSVTSIGGGAFYGCSGLTSVTIPNSVTSIGNFAFCGCPGLTSVTIPNSVTSIGEAAFYCCSGLTSVTIGNSVTSIGQEAFRNCSGLTSIYSRPTVPPTCGTNVFDSSIYSSAVLCVPNQEKALSRYKGLEPWMNFKDIRETEFPNTDDDYDPKFDLNNDGKVDTSDLNLLVKKITDCKILENDSPDYNPEYDINKDGKIDIQDVTVLIKRLVKK